MRDLLVTGTDTGVGKTVVASALVRALRVRGVRAIGFKPVETGVDAGEETDSQVLARAAGERTPLAEPLLQLEEALAPAVAADRAGVTVSPDEIEARIKALRAQGYAVVVEGAGGVMVPLSWQKGGRESFSRASGENDSRPPFYTILDLAEACDLDAVVVGRAGLGTLNHIAMTVTMLRARNVAIRGIVLNRRRCPSDLAESTNPGALARMLPGIRIVEVTDHLSGDPVEATAPLVDRLL